MTGQSQIPRCGSRQMDMPASPFGLLLRKKKKGTASKLWICSSLFFTVPTVLMPHTAEPVR